MVNHAIVRIIENILKMKFGDKKFLSHADVQLLVEEFDERGGSYVTEEMIDPLRKVSSNKKILKSFVEYLFYRNVANYDSMILISAMKGTGKSSAALMIGKEWCKLMGIKFDPDRHVCYSNSQAMSKIDKLNKFEILILDEAIRFACLLGSSNILMADGSEVPIKELENKRNFKIWTYNTKTNEKEIKKAYGCRKIKKEKVYEVELSTGEKITCTKDHKFLIRKNMEYKKLKDIIWGNYIQKQCEPKNFKINKGKRLYDDSLKVFHESYINPPEYKGKAASSYIREVTYKGREDVYEILGVEDNNNYVSNNIISRNSSEDWAKAENKELKKKLGQVRTKHLLFILCFPLKIQKVDKVYLENYVNYWIDLFGRGIGALYVKDNNPAHDSWRMREFTKLGSYSEFTHVDKIQTILSKHPNFWSILKFPKPSEKLYNKYLKVREKNVYDAPHILSTVTKEDFIRAILIMTLKEVMTRDSSLSVTRLLLHLQNVYNMNIDKKTFDNVMKDSKMLVEKIKEKNPSNEKSGTRKPFVEKPRDL